MLRNKSFIIRLFAGLFALLMVILIGAGAAIYGYALQVVGEEFIRLNQASLEQIASATGRTLGEVRAFGEGVSVNSRLIALAGQSGETAEKEARRVLSDLVAEYSTMRTNSMSMIEATVIGKEGLVVSAYNTGSGSLEEVEQDPAFAPLFEDVTNMVMLPTRRNEEGRGIMIYTFQMVFRMEDLLNGEPQGLVVVDLSEVMLHNQYQAFQQKQSRFAVVDESGTVLSARDKEQIGLSCGYTVEQLEQMSAQTNVTRRMVNGEFLLYERIPGTPWYLLEYLDAASAFGPLTLVRKVIVAGIAASSTLALLAMILTARRILRRVVRIQNKMGQVMNGDLTVHIPVEREDEFGRIEMAFNAMVTEIRRLIETVRSGERQKRLAELDFLQAQINPHFIHNTLTSIRFMLEMGKTEQAGEMIYYFSKLLRQTLSRSNEFISLEEEVKTLENYVNLQKYRYQDTFEVTCDIAQDTLQSQVPSLILQPVVENAIFHGVGRSMVHISIRSRREGDRLCLVVEDDGVGMSEEVKRTVLHKDVQVNRVGLRNVHDRIQLNYGKEYGITISGGEKQGTRITFLLPFVVQEPQEGEGEE